ncbi:MAG TPA: pitrilysin family protein [Vicinamibacterales bacterium]|nr:pitrilysin family protein [Vicinamibacterales bacterium]
MKTLRAGAVSVFTLAAVLTLAAQAPPRDIPKIDIEKYSLPNGLEVILSEDHRLPIVGVDVWYHVGPAHEAPGRTGFAHLFEHMMFQGSKHVPGDSHFRLLEGAGGTGLNGTTDFDRTNYFETVPANQLELALWLESDRMGYLLDTVDQAKLTNQQDVVRNERRQSTENSPYGIVQEAFFKALYPAGHPYHGVVIGSHADIQAAKLEDVREFFRQYYAPNNAALAIAGDFDKAATKKLIEKYFGSLKRGPAVPPVKINTPPIGAERRLVIQDNVKLPRVYIGWHTPAFFKDGDADADIAAGVLGDGRSSRLYKKLVYEKQIAQSVSASQHSLMLGSTFAIDAIARPGHTLQELEAAIEEELALILKEGPSAAEVERVRNVLETRTLSGLQRRGGFGGVADQLNLYNHYLGTPDYLTQDVMRRRSVTPDSVRRFAQQYLRPNARVIVHGVPGKQDLGPEVPKPAPQQGAAGAAAEPVNADEPWRATAPKPSAARAAALPTPQQFQLANGLTVLLAPQTGLPLVSASLVVRNGGDTNPIDKPGLASFSAAMLNQGTTTRSATQLAEEIAQIGASLTTGSTMDSSTITTSSLARNFPAALALLADVSLRSTFPADEVERIRASRLADVIQQQSNPGIIANNVMVAALYGLEHPYGFAQLGTADSIKRMTREDLQGFWRAQFVPGNAALIVSGSITLTELRKLAESAFGAWSGGTATAAKLGASALTQPRLVLVDRPGSPQTQLRVATIGAPRSSPDYIRLRVMNAILGGLFSSRINLNLREAKGYTYGAGSNFSFWRGAGPFAVSTGVRTDVSAPAVHEIVSEMKRMVATDVTTDELTLAKDAITQSLPGQFETNEFTVGALSSIFVYGLPLNYYATLPGQITAVMPKDIQTVAAKYLIPEKMVVVAVGDSEKIRKPLETEVAPAELRSLEGHLLPK